MTSPTNVGAIVAEVKLDTDNVSTDLSRALRKAGQDTDDDTRRLGREISNEISESFGDDDSFSDALGRVVRDGSDREHHTFVRTGRRIAHSIGEGLTDSANVFRRIFSGVAQTIGPFLGSIFNVSGRSPAMLILLFVFIGAILGLITAAIHGVRALLSLLALIPNLLFAIGLQATALFFIFNGFFESFGALIAAKNLGELNQALKDVNPQMAAFIKTLFPLKELFGLISDVAKTQFFGALGDVFTRIQANIGQQLLDSISAISGALGRMFETILSFFTQPLFRDFMALITPEITKWLDEFGPAVVRFLEGLTRFGVATLPFLRWFGEAFNRWIASIGEWLDKLATDPEFLSWLDRAKVTMGIFLDLLGAVWETIQIIARNIEKAGGDEFLKLIRDMFKWLNLILDSKFGIDAMKAFLLVTALAIGAAIGLLIIITAFFYILHKIGVAIEFIFLGIRDLFLLIGYWISSLVKGIGNLIKGLGDSWTNFFTTWEARISGLGTTVWNALMNVLTKVRIFLTETLPTRVTGFVTTLKNQFFEIGKQLIQNLIDGALNKLGPLRQAFSFLGNIAKAAIGGDSEKTGVTNTGTSISSGGSLNPWAGQGALAINNAPVSTASNFNQSTVAAFGTGSVQVNINSTNPPTQQQSLAIGQQIGTGIEQQLTRLAVRTM